MKPNKNPFILLIVLAGFSSLATATDLIWTAGATGDFTDSTKFTPAQAPAATGDTVTANGSFAINYLPGYTHNLTSLTLSGSSGGGTFNQTGGDLSIGTLWLGRTSGDAGGASRIPNYSLSGGTVSTGAIQWGNGSNVPGIRISISAGTFSFTGTSMSMGGTSTGSSNINMTGGIFNATAATTLYLGNGGTGKGTINLGGASEFNAASAALVLGQSGTSGSLGTLTLADSAKITTSNIILGGANATFAANGVINLNGGTITTGSIRRGSSSLTPSSTNLVLHADGGTLKVSTHANNSDFLAGTFVNIKAGGLKFDTNGNATTISNNISGIGGLTKQDGATLTLSGKSNYSGGTTVTSGTLLLASGGGTGAIRGAVTIGANGMLSTTVSDALGYNVDESVTSIHVNGGVLNNAFSGNQAYRTAISLTGGSVISTGGGSFNFSSGFGITGNASNITSTISAPISLRGASMDINVAQGVTPNGVDLVVSGVIGQAIEAGSYGITKKGLGTLELNGTNTYTGATTIEAGTLVLGSGGSLASSSTIDIRAGATLDVSAQNGWTLATGQSLQGPGTLDVGVGNTLQIAGILAPGNSPGTIALIGNVHFASGSAFAAELVPTNAPTSDLVNITGGLTIDPTATLAISLFGGDTLLAEGIKFILIDYDSAWDPGNIFAGIADGSYHDFGTLNTYLVDYNDASLGGTALTLTTVPEPGHLMLALASSLCLILQRRRK